MFAVRWVSRSLRHLVKALAAQGFHASQRVVANLLRDLKYSCQANQEIKEGGHQPETVRAHDFKIPELGKAATFFGCQ